jgi:MscS family membrane protein
VNKISVAFSVLLVACIVTSGLAAQNPGILPGAKEAQRPAQQETVFDDPLGRSTPQGTVIGFIKAASKGNYELALEYLDTKTKGRGAEKLVSGLQAVLDYGFSGHLGMLSNKPEGNLSDDLSPSKERVGTVKTPSGSLDVLLERVERGNGPPIWLFSKETLKEVPGTYKEIEIHAIDAYLPEVLVNTLVLGFPVWRWFFVLIIIPLAFGLAILITRVVLSLLLLFAPRTAKAQGERLIRRLTGPIRTLIFALALWVVSFLSQSVLMSNFWAYIAFTLTVVGGAWLCLRVIDVAFALRESRFGVTSTDKISMVQLGRKLSKIMVVIVGALVVFHIAGINVPAVLAGLGIGGIAVAFAAQKTLENLFGGVMIISDKPIHVGDFCRAGEYIGHVESIGLRSTRIRTLKRTVVSVPNGQLAVMSLENYEMRDKIWFHHILRLRYETTTEQLRYVLAEIRKMLYLHPKIETSSARIRFVGLGSSSLDLDVFAYVLETEYTVFLEVQEDLLLRMMEIVEASGAGLALPSQTTYVAGDSGLNAAKSESAIATVRQWRDQGRLPFPDFPPETIKEIDNALEYPPPDSALRNKSKK